MAAVVGITTFGEALCLGGPGILPNAVTKWLVLFLELPNSRDGTGGLESLSASYAREPVSAWTTVIDPDRSSRVNTSNESFPNQSLTELIKGVGIADAVSAGNILWCGHMTDIVGDIIVGGVTFVSGDNVRFPSGSLKVQLKNSIQPA